MFNYFETGVFSVYTSILHYLVSMSTKALSPAPPSEEHKDTTLATHRTPVSALYVPLSILKDVLESTETLPCVKYVASVGVKIIEVAEVRFSLFLEFVVLS